jgi:uncharacterized protein (DUF1697 family)
MSKAKEAAAIGVHVALIRGINVGRAKRVAMADLRAMLKGLGYGEVRSLLNSGNLVYAAPGTPPGETAARIQRGIEAQLGVTARVTALSAAELAEVVAENPLLGIADDPSRLLAAFLMDPADRSRLEPLLDREWFPEMLALGARVAYLWCPSGVRASALSKAVSRAVDDAVTTRNWSTVLKIHALARKVGS